MKIPLRLQVIGWAWLVFATLSLLETSLDFFQIAGKLDHAELLINNPPREFKHTMALVLPIYVNFHLLVFLKFSLAILAIITSINFLRLKSWSLRVLEILTWLMLTIISAFVVFMYKYDASVTADGRSWSGLTEVVVIMSLFSIPFLLIAWQLRSQALSLLFNDTTG